MERVLEEPVPYFTQFTSDRCQQSEFVQQSAHRHIYAAGLEDVPLSRVSSQHPLTPSPSHTPPLSLSQSLVHSEEGVDGGEGVVETILSQEQLEGGEPSQVSLKEVTVEERAETDLKIKQ